MNHPFLSVITVVRNAADSIEACVSSVREQSLKDLEHIVIDGASTDGTREFLYKYGHGFSHLISEPDEGIYHAMNKGLGLASGSFVHFLNATDRYHDAEVLADIKRELDEDMVCYGDLIYMDGRGEKRNLGRSYDWDEELKASRIPQPTLFVPRSMYRQVGGFDVRFRIAADYEMFLRLANRFPVKWIRRPVTLMQAGGVSYRHPRVAFREARQISVRYGMPSTKAAFFYYQKLARFTVARLLRLV